jgi:hypothetical protein
VTAPPFLEKITKCRLILIELLFEQYIAVYVKFLKKKAAQQLLDITSAHHANHGKLLCHGQIATIALSVNKI